MQMQNKISVIIITGNEEKNIVYERSSNKLAIIEDGICHMQTKKISRIEKDELLAQINWYLGQDKC